MNEQHERVEGELEIWAMEACTWISWLMQRTLIVVLLAETEREREREQKYGKASHGRGNRRNPL